MLSKCNRSRNRKNKKIKKKRNVTIERMDLDNELRRWLLDGWKTGGPLNRFRRKNTGSTNNEAPTTSQGKSKQNISSVNNTTNNTTNNSNNKKVNDFSDNSNSCSNISNSSYNSSSSSSSSSSGSNSGNVSSSSRRSGNNRTIVKTNDEKKIGLNNYY